MRDRARQALIGVILVAVVLRGLRLLCRWDEVAWLYAAYPGHTVALLSEGDLLGAMGAWVGLHPPLWPLLHAAQELVLPVPLVFLATSVACSLGAVLLAARRSTLAALLLATGPVQLHYAAELNDYPLVALLTVAAWVERERVAEGAGWGGLGLVAVLSAWTHLLAGGVVLIAILSLPRRLAWRPMVALTVACLPLVPPVLALLGEPGTFRQPPFEAGLVAADLLDRFGAIGLLWLLPVALGARRRPALALGLLGSVAGIAVLVALGIAAPHQFPYLLVLSGPLVLLVDAGVPGRLRALVVVAALAQGVQVGAYDLVRLEGIRQDLAAGGRAVDEAWARSQPGDGLVLVAPAGVNDDDKRAVSEVLWRLRPWWSMPMVVRPGEAYEDYRLGQPREVAGRVVYLVDHVHPELAQVVSRQARTFVVVSRPGRNPEYTTGLQALLGEDPEVVGPDLLFMVEVAPQGG